MKPFTRDVLTTPGMLAHCHRVGRESLHVGASRPNRHRHHRRHHFIYPRTISRATATLEQAAHSDHGEDNEDNEDLEYKRRHSFT